MIECPSRSPKVESLFFSKNWQLYFSLVNLFSTPLQRNLLTLRNPKHVIPGTGTRQEYSSQALAASCSKAYITCFFPQPEKPKSRVPSFLEKLATLLFTGLPLLDPSTAKLTRFKTQSTSSPSTARPRPVHRDHPLRSRSSRNLLNENPSITDAFGKKGQQADVKCIHS